MPAIMGIDYKFDQTNTAPEVGGGSVPVGSIIPIAHGYFGDNANGSFTPVDVAGNTVADMNAWLASNYPDWAVCDGAEPNTDSPIWDAPGKHLPNLTDSRFTCGSTSAGSVGGSPNVTLSANNLPSHKHNINVAAASSGGHAHINMGGPNTGHDHQYYMASGAGGLGFIWPWSNGVNIANFNNPNEGSAQTSSMNHRHTYTGGGNHSHNTEGSLASAGGNSSFSIIPTYLDALYIVRVR